MPPVRLTLAEPLQRTVTILGPDDRPLAGVRLVPVLYAFDGRAMFHTPDDRLERLTIASGADGVATLPYFPATIDPLTVRVTAPGIAPHHLALPDRPGRDRITLKLGRPARLAGSVYNDSGQPASNVPIEVWVENTYDLPWGPGENRKARLPPCLIHFDSGPVRTRADGSFLTPAQLMTGSSYRIIIRPEGSPLVTSDWLTATTELTTVPPLRLQSSTANCSGSSTIAKVNRSPVHGSFSPRASRRPRRMPRAGSCWKECFPIRHTCWSRPRASGSRAGRASRPESPQERKLILVRTSEPPDRTMAPLPAPISFEESRALARRVLEPSLQAALAKGDDSSKWDCLRIASKIDPGRVLELLEKHPFGDPSVDASHPEHGRHRTACRRSQWRPNRSSTRSRARSCALGLRVVGRGLAGPGARSEARVPGARHSSSPRLPRVAGAGPTLEAGSPSWDESPEVG